MLFGYPAQALADNWFHENLVSILSQIHFDVRDGRTALDWPAIIPEPRRNQLRNRRGLRERLQKYQNALALLTEEEREEVRAALNEQNCIQELLAADKNCRSIDELPSGIRSSAADLFEFAFGLLTELGLRDQHYAIIYTALEHKVCPFCGFEAFDAPGAPREDDDHYLAKSKYPFAGANLRNLVPMGHKCNARYKRTKDLLWQGARRRRAVNPYDHSGIEVSLGETEPFGGTKQHLPRWVIQFLPPTEEAETWDEVFSLRERLCRDVLDPSYTKWIDEFAEWCRKAKRALSTVDEVEAALSDYGKYLEFVGFSDRAYLKLAVCRMLRRQCAERNERVIGVLRCAVDGRSCERP